VNVADSLRRPLTATKQSDGDVILRWPNGVLVLSQAEVDRIYAVTNNKPRIQRYPALSASQTDE
jgi:hypothetical protein